MLIVSHYQRMRPVNHPVAGLVNGKSHRDRRTDRKSDRAGIDTDSTETDIVHSGTYHSEVLADYLCIFQNRQSVTRSSLH